MLALWRGAKIEEGFGGLLQREATASLLKLRCAKLEAPLCGAMPDLTTTRPAGRRILGSSIDLAWAPLCVELITEDDEKERGSIAGSEKRTPKRWQEEQRYKPPN